MSRLTDFAVYVTTAQKSSYSGLDGNSRLQVVKAFYRSKGLELPASITVSTSKKGASLSKDEKMSIQFAYIEALKSGNVPEELEKRFAAVVNPEAVCTFAKTLPYSEAVKEWGPAVVASKLVDAFSVADNEEFHKIRKFDVPAAVAVSEIPVFINALQAIYDESTKVESE